MNPGEYKKRWRKSSRKYKTEKTVLFRVFWECRFTCSAHLGLHLCMHTHTLKDFEWQRYEVGWMRSTGPCNPSRTLMIRFHHNGDDINGIPRFYYHSGTPTMLCGGSVSNDGGLFSWMGHDLWWLRAWDSLKGFLWRSAEGFGMIVEG